MTELVDDKVSSILIQPPPPDDPLPAPPGSSASVAIDLFREITRNVIAIGVVGGGGLMLFKFVEMSVNKENIMMLVIGLIGGFISGTLTWFFGGAMRSALAALQQGK